MGLVPCVLDKTIEAKALVPEAHLTATVPTTIAFPGRSGPFTTVKETFLACVLIRVPAAPDAPATVLTGGPAQSHPLDATGTWTRTRTEPAGRPCSIHTGRHARASAESGRTTS
ncbi:hypothetical protein [Embleya sp. NPDC059237]|uniref:hypothetical protein n=1 Tax=Embleya sp. NPDC059237 TaxID=3346784 RepID=UPI0036A4D90F